MATGIENELEEAGDDVEKLKKLVRDKDKQITEQNDAITSVTTLYENERNKNKKLQEDVNKLTDDLKKCREELKKCKARQEELEKELEKCKEEVKKCKEGSEDLEKCKERQKELEKELEKCKTELEKCQKEKEELKKELEKCKKEKEELEKNKSSCGGWIPGEYKWMPAGSKMPEGWEKVDLKEGHTLVQGEKEGTSSGELKSHWHYHGSRWYSWDVKQIWYNTVGGGNGFNGRLFPNTEPGNANCAPNTENYGENLKADQKDNLAAGIFAELWQFKGTENCK